MALEWTAHLLEEAGWKIQSGHVEDAVEFLEKNCPESERSDDMLMVHLLLGDLLYELAGRGTAAAKGKISDDQRALYRRAGGHYWAYLWRLRRYYENLDQPNLIRLRALPKHMVSGSAPKITKEQRAIFTYVNSKHQS